MISNNPKMTRQERQLRLKSFLLEMLRNDYYDMQLNDVEILIPYILKKQTAIIKDYFGEQDINQIYIDIQEKEEFRGFFNDFPKSNKLSTQEIAELIFQQLKLKPRHKQALLKILVQKDYAASDRILSGPQKIRLNQLLSEYYLIDNTKQRQQSYKQVSENKQIVNSLSASEEINRVKIQEEEQISKKFQQENSLIPILRHFLQKQGQLQQRSVLLLKYLVELFISSQIIGDTISLHWQKLPLQQRMAQFNKLQNLTISNLNQHLLVQIIRIIKMCELCLLYSLKIKIESSSQRIRLQKTLNDINDKINILTSREQFKSRVQKKRNMGQSNLPNNIFWKQQKNINNQLHFLIEFIYDRQTEYYYKFKTKKIKCLFNHQQFNLCIIKQQLAKTIQQITRTKAQNLIIFYKSSNNQQEFEPFDLLSSTTKFTCLKIFNKQSVIIHYKQNRIRTDISKDLNLSQAAKLILYSINKKQQNKILQDRFRLNLVFQRKPNILLKQTQLLHSLESQFGNLLSIQIQIESLITLYYRGQQYKFNQWQNDSISLLKLKIKQKLQIPAESQIIQYQINKQTLQLESKQSLSRMKIFNQQIDVSLLVKANLQFYGFHHNIQLDYDRFKQFFIENQQNRNQYLSFCKLKQDEENLFFNKAIPYIFSSIKKRLDLESVIRMFREQVSEHTKQQIWTSSKQINTFNPTFLLYYILYNSETKLRVQIMNLVKHYYPLPLYFRQFSSITNIQNNWFLNEQLIWILKNQLNIVSVGLHNQEEKTEYGKSDLLNRIFYTNFIQCFSKHGIVLSCPEISLRIYGNAYPVNLIDINSKTPQNISDSIIKKANFVILHSWKNQRQTLEQVKRIKALNESNVYVLIIMRDVRMDSKDNWLIRAKQLINDTIQLYNLSAKIDPITIQIIIKEIKKIVHQKIEQVLFKKQKYQIKTQLISTSEKQINDFQNILCEISQILTQFRPVTRRYKQFEKNSSSQQNLQNRLKKELDSFKLHPIIQKILIFISENQKYKDLLIERFRQKIKSYRESFQQRYKILVYAKKDFDRLTSQQSKEYQQKLKQYLDVIRKLPGIRAFSAKTRIDVLKGLSQAIEQYEDNIKPELISIQLLWRELYQLEKINPKYKIGNELLIDFIIDIQRKQIFNSQPFELLDGDSLRMPKRIIKKIFDSVKGTAATVIILGPQSSGKSTLLNYLFGCDFKTSEGRCTRGVYGTYYSISNSSMFSCDSILLIDTEGLLAITNKKDEKIRADFDSKLILFCLAISDFVIVNTKSDLDSQTIGKLKACKQRLPTLSSDSNPEFWLVMNQSQTSDMSNKANDVNRLQDLFDLGNSRCLSQAFDTKVLGSEQICILGQDILTKKKSRNDFQKMTLKLQSDLMQRISTKTYRLIPKIIQKMQVIWSTIQRYPDLGKNDHIQIKQIDLEISKWKEQHSQQLDKFKDDLIQQFLSNTKNTQQIESEFIEFKRQLQQKFQKYFSFQEYSQSVIQRISIKKKSIIVQFEHIFKKLRYQIQEYQIKNKIKIQQQQGNIDIKVQIKRIKQEQVLNSIIFSQEQRKQRFQKVFNKTIEKLEKSINQQKQIKDQFQRIKEIYQGRVKQHCISIFKQIDKIILPGFYILPTVDSSHQQYKEQVLRQFKRQSNLKMIIQDSAARHTYALGGGKMDASLKYFNMNDYFENKESKVFITIKKQQFFNSFKKDMYLSQIKKSYEKEKKKDQFEIIQRIVKQINFCMSLHGLKFKQQDQTIKYFQKIFTWHKDKTSQGFLNFLYKKSMSSFSIQSKAPFLERIGFCSNDIEIQSKFLNQGVLEDLIKNSINKDKNSGFWTNLSQSIIRKAINLNLIFQEINESSNIQTFRQKHIQNFIKRLQKQLVLFGFRISYEKIKEQISKKETITSFHFFKSIYQEKLIKLNSSQQFTQLLSKLEWFNIKHIQRYYKQRQQEAQNQICLNTFSKFQLKPKQNNRYRIVNEYRNQQNRQVINHLKNQDTYIFLWNQLHQKKAFDKLFSEFDKIIGEATSKNLSEIKTIEEIFAGSAREIQSFNDDISQLSKKLTFNFQGFCHMYVIYMTWKTISIKQEGVSRKPIEEWIQQKQKHFIYFMNMTSNLTQKVCQGEVLEFLKKITEIYDLKVDKIKSKMIKKQIQFFKMNITREIIQRQIDYQTFQKGADQTKMIEYIQKPDQIVLNKFEEAIQKSIDNLQHELKNQMYHIEFFKEITQQITQIYKKLIDIYQINQSDGGFSSFFRIESINQQKVSLLDGSLNQISSNIFMKYFIDNLLNKKQPIYNSQTFNAFIKQDKENIIFNTTFSQQTSEYFQALQKDNLSMTNIIIFLAKLKDNFSSLKNDLFDKMIFSKQQIQDFTNEVKINICSQKCPCCDRICGLEGSHSDSHQCVYGHQIRAFAGTKYQNGDASVCRCEDMTDTSQIKYNGNNITWKEFIDQQALRGWNFDDLINKDPTQQSQFHYAWTTIGNHFCTKYGMNFVDFNNVAHSHNSQSIHYIFALDESGSMNAPNKWPQVVKTLNQILPTIKLIPNYEQTIKMSVLLLSSACKIHQQNTCPDLINFNGISPSYGGTYFAPTFQTAYDLMNKYHTNSNIMFILLTDGEAEYPTNQINLIKQLKARTKNKIYYSGIEFQTTGKIMKEINSELDGRNFNASTQSELLKAFSNAIQIINSK